LKSELGDAKVAYRSVLTDHHPDKPDFGAKQSGLWRNSPSSQAEKEVIENSSEVSAHMARRRFIIETVEKRGFVPLSELEKAEHSTHPQTLKDDEKWLSGHGLLIKRTESGFASARPEARYWLYNERKKEQEKEKQVIGQFGASLIAASTTGAWKSRWQDKLLQQLTTAEKTRASSRKNVDTPEAQLLRGYARQLQADQLFSVVRKDLETRETDGVSRKERETAEFIHAFFNDYAAKRSRHVALDSGTTSAAVALALKELSVGRLVKLTVVTNAPRIEQILDHPDIPIDVIGLGGKLRKDTLARTGHLLDVCLSAWGLEMDISLIGATSIRFDHLGRPRGLACDSESEAHTKALLLERGTLRAVIMDSSKCNKSASSSFEFCDVGSQSVHMIITDNGISKTKRCKECLEGFRKQGIVVLQAPLEIAKLIDEAGSDEAEAR
jgi:DeoR/GlpR family transcriptional regulator of sugar metabolism